MSGLPKKSRSPYTKQVSERRAQRIQEEIQDIVVAFKLALKSHPTILTTLIDTADEDIRRPLNTKLLHNKRRLLFHFLRTSGYTANEIQPFAKVAANTILYHEKYTDDLIRRSPTLKHAIDIFYTKIKENLGTELAEE